MDKLAKGAGHELPILRGESEAMKHEVYIPDKLYAEWQRAFPYANTSMVVRQMMEDQLAAKQGEANKTLYDRMYRAGAR